MNRYVPATTRIYQTNGAEFHRTKIRSTTIKLNDHNVTLRRIWRRGLDYNGIQRKIELRIRGHSDSSTQYARFIQTRHVQRV